MLPSESALEEAIGKLDAAGFQRLAEAYAEFELPARFAKQQILGRNTSGSTTAGWPDSYSLMTDGRIDVLEATRDVRNWTTHLDRDLKKAARLTQGRIGGFAFITFGRTPRPATLTPRREALAGLGVAHSHQTFVFRQDLVRTLRSGRFACVWADILGLSPSVFPFSELRRASIYGGASPEQFVPTEDEYEKGDVSLPSISAKVDARLSQHGFASVRGRGAAGKTVLAAGLGFSRLKKDRPVYYLDLADHQERRTESLPQILGVLSVRGDLTVLFIVDNTHQDESAAAEIYAQWEAVGNDSQLLFLGRQADSPLESKGLRSPLASIEGSPFKLRADRDALLGVFSRLKRRRNPDTSPVKPPPSVLSSWLETFGGDLIAFSAALARRNPGPEEWELLPSDARDYVEEHYLAGLSEAELQALCLVADLSALEISTPIEVVRPAMVERALRGGVLERRQDDIRTVHPGIGELIVAAAGARIGDFAGPATSSGDIDLATAAATAQRLARSRGRRATRIVESLLSSGYSVLAVLQGMRGSGPSRLGALRDILGADVLEAHLQTDESSLREFVKTASLDDLTQLTLAFRGRLDPAVAYLREAVDAEIESGQINIDRLVEDAAGQPIQLPLTLRYLDQFGGKLRPLLLPRLAAAGVIQATLFSGGLGAPSRWRDMLGAAKDSTQVAAAMADAIRRDPEETLAFLMKGDGRKIDAARTVPVVQDALIETVQSPWFREKAREAPTVSAHYLTLIVKIATAYNPTALIPLEALAYQPKELERSVVSWSSGAGAHRHLLNTTQTSCPALHDALKVALRARGESWTTKAIQDGRVPPNAVELPSSAADSVEI